MVRRAKLHNAFPRGVLDPDLYERIDLAHYYLAVADAQNQIVTQQGGLQRRPNSVATGQRLRRRLEPIPLTSGMVDNPNSGTVANLIDQDPDTAFTTDAVDSDEFVIASFNLGSAQKVVFVDVSGFVAGTAGRDDCLVVEWWDGAAWQPFDGSGDPGLSPRKNIRTTARNRRFGTAPGAQPTAQLFRIVIYGGSGPGTISIANVRFWREQEALSPVKIIGFAKTSAETYELALTDRNIDVFRNGAYYASIAIQHGAELIREVIWAQSLDTLLLFHKHIQTTQIVRQGAHDEWNPAEAAFTSVPELTASTAFSGNQDEEQEIEFTDLEPGDAFALFLGDLVTAPVTYSDNSALLTSLSSAIEALPGVNATNVAVTLVSASPLKVRVAFTGSNGSRAWPILSPVVIEPADASIAVTVTQAGLDSSGDLMGETTGWPSAGLFYQARLLLAGFRAAPSTYAFSRVGLYYDYETTGDPITADLAIVNSLDSDQVESILRAFVGQHLQLFTEEGEWYIEARTIDATQPLNVVRANSYGIAPAVAPIFVQGGTLFMQSGETVDGVKQPDRVLRDMIFDVAERNNYTAEPLSLLAPHLLTDVVDIAHRPGVGAREASLVMLLNRSGDFAMLTLLRSQQVIALTPGSTLGEVRAIGTDKNRNLWWAVEREIDGETNLWLERVDDSALLDAQVTMTGTASTTVTGLDHVEGREDVWVYADGDIFGPFTVAGGQVELDEPAEVKIAGLFAPLYGRTLPLREKLQEAQPFRPPVRVYEAEWSMRQCGPFEMRANYGDWREVPTRHLDGGPIPKEATGEEPEDTLDAPLLERLYSGRMKVENLLGSTRDGIIEWRQLTPAPFKIRALRYQVSYR